MIPNFGKEADEAIDKAIKLFPETFRLRSYPIDLFRLSRRASYVSNGVVLLYTQRLLSQDSFLRMYGRNPRDSDELWVDFAKGTVKELQNQKV